MSFAATAATIRQRFAAEFALVRAAVPVAYPTVDGALNDIDFNLFAWRS